MILLYEENWNNTILFNYKDIGSLLMEEKGVAEDLLSINKELVEMILQQKPLLINSNLYLINCDGYKPQKEEFLTSFNNFKIYFGKGVKEGQESYFLVHKGYNHLDENNKLKDIDIVLYIHQEKLDKDAVSSELLHELQHAYWFWRILTSKNKNAKETYAKRMSHYKQCQIKYDDSPYEKLIKDVYYTQDPNEINARGVQLYHLIISDPSINKGNVMDKLHQTSFFKDVEYFQYILTQLEDLSEDKIIALGQAYNNIFNLNKTPYISFKLFKQLVVRGYQTMLDKYYQIASKAINDAIQENQEYFRDVMVLREWKIDREIIKELFK